MKWREESLGLVHWLVGVWGISYSFVPFFDCRREPTTGGVVTLRHKR